MSNQIECIRFKHIGKGALLGFADIYVPSFGLEFYGCSVFQKDGHKWMSFPSRETSVDENGKKKFWPHVRFRKRESMDAFCISAMTAIEKKMRETPQQEQTISVFPFLSNDSELPF